MDAGQVVEDCPKDEFFGSSEARSPRARSFLLGATAGRATLRAFFEVDRHQIVLAAPSALRRQGRVDSRPENFRKENSMKPRLTLSLFVALVGLQTTGHAQTLPKIKADGGITVGVRDASLPLSYSGADGSPVGFNVDICRRIVSGL